MKKKPMKEKRAELVFQYPIRGMVLAELCVCLLLNDCWTTGANLKHQGDVELFTVRKVIEADHHWGKEEMDF